MQLRRSVAEETESGVATALRKLLERSVPDDVDTRLSYSGDESIVPPDVGAQVYLINPEGIYESTRLTLRKGDRPVYDPKKVLHAHVARYDDLAVHAYMRVHAVTVLHLHPAANIRHSLRP